METKGISINDVNQQEKIPKFIDINSQITCSAVQAAINLCNETKITRSVKTPISLLQEIATKCSCQPVYENISTEGQVHEPLFIYKVTVGDISAVAKGSNKKNAKHAAALSLLNEIKIKSIGRNDVLAYNIEHLIKSITQANDDENTSEATENSADPKQETDTDQANADKTNPVGNLLELTQKLSLRPPKFEFSEDEGLPHNKTFSCRTEFEQFNEVGHGRSKKIAKRNAAQQLLCKFKESTKALELEKMSNDAALANLIGGNSREKNKKQSSNFFSQIKNSDKPVTLRLLGKSQDATSNLAENNLTKAIFESMATEEKFTYNFFNLGKNKTGLNRVLLQIKSNPNLVVNGLGITMDEALDQAAINALQLIILLCNR